MTTPPHDHVDLEHGAVVGPNVVFADDGTSRTVVRSCARIGAGTIVAAGVEIGSYALIRPGSVVLESIPANAVAQGNPAEVVGYVGAEIIRGSVTVVPIEKRLFRRNY